MPKMIFVNLPVTDLQKAMAFYQAIGFENNPQFTDDTAACMVWSEAIFVMLLTHDKWRTFTKRPIPPATSSEVLLAISFEDIAAVDTILDAVAAFDGAPDINAKQDYGWMYSRSFADPDGHVWECMWMDMAASGEQEAIS